MTPHLPRDIIRKQYYNRMTVAQLQGLYDVSEDVIRDIVRGITPKERHEERGVAPLETTLSKNRFVEYLDKGLDASAIAYNEGAEVEEVRDVAKLYGLSDLLAGVSAEQMRAERNEKIRALVIAGKTAREVAAELDINVSMVYDTCKKFGLTLTRSMNLHKQGRRERANEVEALAKQGYNINQIAARLELSPNTVRNITNDYGIKVSRRAKKEETT